MSTVRTPPPSSKGLFATKPLARILAESEGEHALKRTLGPIQLVALGIGAIIGETPASIQEGLGGAIVNFNQYYSLQPTALWATNIVCAVLGLVLFGLVALTERLVLRRAPEHVA